MAIAFTYVARCRRARRLAWTLLSVALSGIALPWHRPAPAQTADAAQTQAPVPTQMRFPADFPGGFLLYETIDDADNAVVVKRYANPLAVRAARGNSPLPDGSVIIVATHAAEADAVTNKLRRDAGGRLVAGPLRAYAGMESRAGWGAAVPAPLRNADWHYASFGADRAAAAAMNQLPCLACHQPAAQDSYVFTLKTLREAASRAAY